MLSFRNEPVMMNAESRNELVRMNARPCSNEPVMMNAESRKVPVMTDTKSKNDA